MSNTECHLGMRFLKRQKNVFRDGKQYSENTLYE